MHRTHGSSAPINFASFLIVDLSSPVCLFCGSRQTGKVYLLDINKKEMRTLDVDVSSQSHYFSLMQSRKHRFP